MEKVIIIKSTKGGPTTEKNIMVSVSSNEVLQQAALAAKRELDGRDQHTLTIAEQQRIIATALKGVGGAIVDVLPLRHS